MMTAEGSELDRNAAGRVHYATDPRIRRLAEAMWRTETGGTYMEWLGLGKDSPDTYIHEAREWVRAAVAGGVMEPPEPGTPALTAAVADAQCSFCGKTPEQRVTIVSGPGVAICGECIELVSIIHGESAGNPTATVASSAPQLTHVQSPQNALLCQECGEFYFAGVACPGRDIEVEHAREQWLKSGDSTPAAAISPTDPEWHGYPQQGGRCEDCLCCTALACANGPDGPIGARCVTNSLGESSCPCTCA